jgi:glycosyltransferase involved in cell wall biosynthesis
MKNQNDLTVSVIIPTYNRSQLLSYTLDSLVQQDLPKDRFEVVVGDDGSSDDTRQVVGKYEALMNVKYAFQEDKGYRPGSARNKAISISEGDICLFIDSSVSIFGFMKIIPGQRLQSVTYMGSITMRNRRNCLKNLWFTPTRPTP